MSQKRRGNTNVSVAVCSEGLKLNEFNIYTDLPHVLNPLNDGGATYFNMTLPIRIRTLRLWISYDSQNSRYFPKQPQPIRLCSEQVFSLR
jgi:hypothetical protein